MKELDSIPWQNPIWSELADVCSTAALTPAELFGYEEELRKQWDLEATFLAKEEKGRDEGRDDKAREIALNMLTDGCSADVVCKYTGLSSEEIQKLRAGNP